MNVCSRSIQPPCESMVQFQLEWLRRIVRFVPENAFTRPIASLLSIRSRHPLVSNRLGVGVAGVVLELGGCQEMSVRIVQEV